MRESTIEVIIDADINEVWEIVTNLKEYHWRSDLVKIDIIDEKQFIEYYKGNHSTTFTITKKIRNELYEFDMVNDKFTGHWIGGFFDENGKTKIIFTEIIKIKNPFIKLLSYLFMNLKKQQYQYVEDLTKKLQHRD